ncbi:MAG: L,D-transpeptidase [Reyranella sp.]|nr:L,D-transpeptidase [Reyranella sp.]MDP3162936.1 L,D-transpeptidase [Reyranella sp.]
MATTIYPTVPVAQPEAELWPVDNDPISIQADEMFARQLDTGFAGEIRNLVHDPETGLAGKDPETALGGVAEAIPLLGELKDRYLAQAIGPRQKAILEPLINTRLDRATGDLGRIAQQATSVLDDRSVAERLAGLHQDAMLAWRDPAQLRVLGQAAVGELRYQGERKGWDATQTDTNVRQSLSDLYAGAIEQAIRQDLDGANDLYEHARDVIQPERQAAIDRRFVEAREDKTVARVGDDLRAGWAKMSIAPSMADFPDIESTARPRPDIRWFLDQAAAQLDDNSSPRLRGLVQNEATAQFFRAGKEWLTERSQSVANLLKWQKENPTALFTDVPSDLRSKMSPDQIAAFRFFANVQGHIEPDLGLYDRLERDLLDRPRKFADMALDEYALHVGVDGVDRLSGLQEAIRKGDPDGQVAHIRTGRRLVENAILRAGFEPDATVGQSARAGVRDRIEEFAKVNGRAPTEDDIVRVVNEETASLKRDGGGVQTDGLPSTDVQLAQAKQGADPKNGQDSSKSDGRDPSKFYLKFDGRYLKLYDGEEVIGEWPAVSGKENFGSGKDQKKVNYGPIPEGTYDIKQSRYQTISAWNRVLGWVGSGEWAGSVRGWGTERVWADPTKETEASGLTFGRKDMAIHGGSSPGSAGCIDLTDKMTDFAKEFRKMGVDLKLYVDYSPPIPTP